MGSTAMKLKNLLAGAALAIGLILPASAQAASDTFTVYDALGNIFVSVSLDDSVENAGTIITVPVAFNAALFGDATNLTEPGGGFSDIFGICTCGIGGALALGFASDTETQAVNFGSFPRTFAEGNGIFDATRYLDSDLQRQGYSAQFVSDVESAVPEPATWAMMLFGFGIMGVGIRRQREKQFKPAVAG